MLIVLGWRRCRGSLPGFGNLVREGLGRSMIRDKKLAGKPGHWKMPGEVTVDTWDTQATRIFFSGPLLPDGGQLQLGSLFILGVGARAEVKDFIGNKPYSNAGIFKSAQILRMRKGPIQPRKGLSRGQGATAPSSVQVIPRSAIRRPRPEAGHKNAGTRHARQSRVCSHPRRI